MSDGGYLFHSNLKSLTINTPKGLSFSNTLIRDAGSTTVAQKQQNNKNGNIWNSLLCPNFKKLSLRCTNTANDDKYQSKLWHSMKIFNLWQNIEHLIITDMFYKRNIDQFLDLNNNGWLHEQMLLNNSNIKKITMQLTKDSNQWTAVSLTNCAYIMQHLIYLRSKLINNDSNSNTNSKRSRGLFSGLKNKNKSKNNFQRSTTSSSKLESIEIEWKIQEKSLEWKPMSLNDNDKSNDDDLIASWIALQNDQLPKQDYIDIMSQFQVNDGLSNNIIVDTDLTLQSLQKIYYNMCKWMSKIVKQHSQNETAKVFYAKVQLIPNLQ